MSKETKETKKVPFFAKNTPAKALNVKTGIKAGAREHAHKRAA